MLEPPRIVIADGDVTTLRILSRQLSDVFSVRTVSSGADALALALSDEPPDLFLIEVHLPDMNGFDLCRSLQVIGPDRSVPVIFLTAHVSDEEELEGFAAGAVDYVTKPVRPALLIARMRSQIELTRTRARLAASNEALQEAACFREEVDRILRHDLKGPLTGIMGIPQYMLEESPYLCDEDREMLRALERAGASMLTMINRSLDVFKIEQGVYRFRPTAVEFLSLLRSVITECQESLSSSLPVRLWLDGREVVPDDRVLIAGETLLTHSLFANLVRNAVEASPRDGAVDVRVRAEFESGLVRVQVVNQGAVPVAIRGRFFEKYVTAGKSRGTGLGTYAARLAAETQGGAIRLDCSRPGWTTLIVTLGMWTDGFDCRGEMRSASVELT